MHLGSFLHAYATKQGAGQHAALLQGHTMGVGTTVIPEDQGKVSHQERIQRLMHTAVPSRASLAKDDLAVVRELERPGPDAKPLTKRGLTHVLFNLLAGVDRLAKANPHQKEALYNRHM